MVFYMIKKDKLNIKDNLSMIKSKEKECYLIKIINNLKDNLYK